MTAFALLLLRQSPLASELEEESLAASRIDLNISQRWQGTVILPESYVPPAVAEASRDVNVDDWALEGALDNCTAILTAEVTIPGGGTYQLDLTAAPIIGAESAGVPSATESLAGKRLAGFLFRAPSTNAAPILVAPASTNGYLLFGAAITGGVKIESNDHWSRVVTGDTLPEVTASAKLIDLTGTAADVLQILMAFRDV